ncbi:MAG: nitrilase-related carbon-nitrogen hydrolase [Paludibaculum sp.]
MRIVTVAAAQMGPIQKADSREAVVRRMIALMDEAKAKGADLIVYPELALTTFFPRWYIRGPGRGRYLVRARDAQCGDEAAVRACGAASDGDELRLCRADARRSSFQHRDPDRPKSGRIVGKYRKVHLPGHVEFDTGAHAPASGEALFRAGRSRLQRLARARRHLRHGRSATTGAGPRPTA